MNNHGLITPLAATFGRYVLHPAIARGSTSTVHPAHVVGQGGFARLVAARRLHRQFAANPEVVAYVQEEACIASRIHHPNVVPVLDVVAADREIILVQEYVHGVPLGILVQRGMVEDDPVPVEIAVAVVAGILAGLGATHEAKAEPLAPSGATAPHRDGSALNVIVSVDGVARLLDCGVTRSRQTDLYAAGLVLWQLLHPWISSDRRRREKLARLEPVLTRALAANPRKRHATAADALEALLGACRPASATEVAAWVRSAGAEHLEKRRASLEASEASWREMAARTSSAPPPPSPPSSAAAALRLAPFLPWFATAVSLLVLGILAGIAVEAARPAKVVDRGRSESSLDAR